MSRLALIIAVVASILTGCSPYNFTLQKETGWEIDGKKAVNHHNVVVEAKNLVTLEPKSGVFMRCEQLTDAIFNTEMTLFSKNEGGSDFDVSLRLRSTPYDDTVLMNDNGFVLIISDDVVSVVSDDQSVSVPVELPPAGEPFRVVVKQHGQVVEATVACTFVGRYFVSTPTTQWISVQTPGKQRVELRDPTFRPIHEDFQAPVNGLLGLIFGTD